MAKLAKRMEENLTLVSIVGLRSITKPAAVETIESLRDMGIRVGILTGDDYSHTKMAMSILKLSTLDQSIHVLDFNDAESGVSKIKDILEEMRKLIETERKGESGKDGGSPLKRAKTAVEAGELEKLNNFILMFSG